MTKKTALFYERYELKFHIPYSLVDPICKFIEPYCQLDYYSKKSDDKYYMINNLYLDSPNYLFLQRRMAQVEKRFNLRIRSYGEELTDNFFFEIKHKNNGFIQKKRAAVKGSEWFHYLKNFDIPVRDDQKIIKNDYAYDFAYLLVSHLAEPKIFTQYRRKAYFSTIDDYARVTFDKELKYQERHDYNFSRENLDYYDNPTIFTPEANVILELKSYTRFPFWMMDVIKHFDLNRMSFSKYKNGLKEVMENKFQTANSAIRDLSF